MAEYLSPALLRLAQANGGYLNFNLVVARRNHPPLTYAFSRRVEAGLSAVSAASRSIGTEESVCLEAGPLPQLAPVPAPFQLPFVTGTQPQSGVCDYYQRPTSYSKQFMKVGEMHNARDSVATFTYGQKADSTVEVAHSPSGSGWSFDGTAQVSNSSSYAQSLTRNSSQWFDAGWQLTSEFDFGKTEYIGENACAGRTYYLVRALRWDGGWGFGNDVSSMDGHPNQYAVSYPAGSIAWKNTATAYDYSAAVTVFNATLSATNGYSQCVMIKWTFSGFTQQLYGNDASPPNAQIVYAN